MFERSVERFERQVRLWTKENTQCPNCGETPRWGYTTVLIFCDCSTQDCCESKTGPFCGPETKGRVCDSCGKFDPRFERILEEIRSTRNGWYGEVF